MISKEKKLHSKHFSLLRKENRKAQTITTDSLVIKIFSRDNRDYSRVAVRVSKKLIKSAVKRNLFKRRMYDILRDAYPQLCELLPHHYIIFSIKKQGILDIHYHSLKRNIQSFLDKMKKNT